MIQRSARVAKSIAWSGSLPSSERRRRGRTTSRARVFAAELEVLGEHAGVRSPARQPFGRRACARLAVFVGEHRVGRLANQRVVEGELALTRYSRGPTRDEHLAPNEFDDDLGHRRVHRLAHEQRHHGAGPECFAADAGSTKHAAGIRVEPIESRLNRTDHGLR